MPPMALTVARPLRYDEEIWQEGALRRPVGKLKSQQMASKLDADKLVTEA